LTTRSPDQRFEEELEVFRTEAEGALQFFYAYLTVHAVAVAEASVHEALNETPLFGNTMLSALQTATFTRSVGFLIGDRLTTSMRF
jgi:hypothetical protein